MRILYYTSQPLINKYVNMVFNVHRNHKAYQSVTDGGKGVWTEVGEEPPREGDNLYLSLHCHHQNDSCIKMGSDESHFNVSVGIK